MRRVDFTFRHPKDALEIIETAETLECELAEIDAYFDGENLSDDFETILDLSAGKIRSGEANEAYIVIKIVKGEPV